MQHQLRGALVWLAALINVDQAERVAWKFVEIP
jgi:hypothetical protein